MNKPVFKNRENEQTKTEDGRTIFLSRSCAICVPVAARDSSGQLYLLLSRRGENTPNFQHAYNHVCGYLDYNETLEEAAKRELWEEVGLNVDALEKEKVLYPIETSPWSINSKPEGSVQNVTIRFGLFFECETKSDLPQLSTDYCEEGEVSEAVWLEYEEALKIISFDGTDPLKEKQWAFNHFDICREWLDKINNL